MSLPVRKSVILKQLFLSSVSFALRTLEYRIETFESQIPLFHSSQMHSESQDRSEDL